MKADRKLQLVPAPEGRGRVRRIRARRDGARRSTALVLLAASSAVLLGFLLGARVATERIARQEREAREARRPAPSAMRQPAPVADQVARAPRVPGPAGTPGTGWAPGPDRAARPPTPQAAGIEDAPAPEAGGAEDAPAPATRPATGTRGAAVPRRGRTIHVAAGASQGGDGSRARPFGSVQRALEAARPGEVVRVGAGVYREAVHSVRPGRLGAPIRLLGEGAKLTGGGGGHLVELRHDDLELRGFELSGAGSLVWAVATDRVRVVGNWLHDAGGECVRLRGGAKGNEIAGNRIEGCGLTDFRLGKGRKNGEGIYIGTAPEQLGDGKNPTDDPDASDGNWVHDNLIRPRAECVDVKEHARDNVVERNDCAGAEDPESGGFSSRGQSTVLRDNVSADNAGAGIRLGGDEHSDGVGSVVYGNRLTGNDGYGLKVMRDGQGVICGNRVSGNDDGLTNVTGVVPTVPCRA